MDNNGPMFRPGRVGRPTLRLITTDQESLDIPEPPEGSFTANVVSSVDWLCYHGEPTVKDETKTARMIVNVVSGLVYMLVLGTFLAFFLREFL